MWGLLVQTPRIIPEAKTFWVSEGLEGIDPDVQDPSILRPVFDLMAPFHDSEPFALCFENE